MKNQTQRKFKGSRYIVSKRATDGYTTISVSAMDESRLLKLAFQSKKFLASAFKQAALNIHGNNRFPANFSAECVSEAERILTGKR
jgi:hypothetical protein